MSTAPAYDSLSGADANANITTAVVFLEEVAKKGYEKDTLRTYLVNKCGLSNAQVSKAVKVHAELSKNRKLQSSFIEGEKGVSGENKALSANGLEYKNIGATKPKIKYTSENVLNFLKADKQKDGLQVIKEFLKTEWKYCNILTCLEDYSKELTELAGKRKIKISVKEVKDIFVRLPSLLHFHRMFYTDLNAGYSIGELFIKCFNFFKVYIWYMKSCTTTINKMRQYTRDKKLHNYLAQIRQRSKCVLEDMFDLLLFPLDRVSDYKVFLDKLCELADEKQTLDYEYLTKAARRIGRIADYIDKYKYWIFNRSEMNRVQRFLDDQWEVLAPHRRIIRRGIMIRRSTGWSQRNKRFIFFLFNDLFLWTTEKGELQNVVHLWNCKVMTSDSKYNTLRTFRLVFMGKKHGTLLLECATSQQRKEWYTAIEKAICGANSRIAQAWQKADPKYSKDDEPSGEGTVFEEVPEDDASIHGTGVVRPMRATSLSVERRHREKKESISQKMNIFAFASEVSYDEQYESTHNFRLQEFKGFEAMDDAISLTGSDQPFPNAPVSPSTDAMSSPKIKPKVTRASSEEKKYTSGVFSYGAYDKFSDAQTPCPINRRSLRESFSGGKKVPPIRIPEEQTLDSPGYDNVYKGKDRRNSMSSSTSVQVFGEHRSKALRGSENSPEDNPLETLLRRNSSYTMRLNDIDSLCHVSEK